MEETNFLAGDADLEGIEGIEIETMSGFLDGENDSLAGSDLGFLPMLAAGLAPKLMAMAAPAAASILRSQAPRIMSMVNRPRVANLARGFRLSKPTVRRAVSNLASGKNIPQTFLDVMQSQNTEEEQEVQGFVESNNANNPLMPLFRVTRDILNSDKLSGSEIESLHGDISDMWNKVKGLFTKTSTTQKPLATKATATTTQATGLKKLTSNTTKPVMIQRPIQNVPTTINKPVSPTPSSNQALIAKPPGGTGFWTNPYFNRLDPSDIPNYLPKENQTQKPTSSGGMIDMFGNENSWLLMYLLNSNQKRSYRKYYRPRSYRYRPRSYGYRPRSYGYRPRSYGYRPRSYGYRPRSYGYRPRSYGYRPRSYSYSYRKYRRY
jgi:hypothetical protein